MSSFADVLRYQIQSAAWANQRVLTAAAALPEDHLTHDFKTSEHCILATLVHIYRAERMWFSRVEGPVVEYRMEGDDAMSTLETNWPKVSRNWVDWSQALTDQAAQAELTYRDLRNNQWTQPLWQIVLHVVNHSTHHRGQAVGFLRSLGHTPPSTDSIIFARQR